MRLRFPVLIGSSLLWASGWIAAPLLAHLAPPFAVSALIFALAACLLFPFRTHPRPVPLRTNLLLGMTQFAAPAALLCIAGRYAIDGWIPLLYSFMPLFLAIVGEGWTPATVIAPGAVLVLLNGTVPLTPAKLFGAVPALAAVGLQAWSLSYAATHLPGRAWPRALAAQLAIAACVLACLSFFFNPRPRFQSVPPAVLAAVVGLALLGTAVPYAGLYFLLSERRLLPAQIAVSQWLQTLFAVAGGAILVRAHPPAAVWVAAAVLALCTRAVLSRHDAFSA